MRFDASRRIMDSHSRSLRRRLVSSKMQQRLRDLRPNLFAFCSLPFVKNVNTILKVRLGEYDVSTTAEPLKHEEFNISDIVIHPGFNNSTLVHDIALLRLEKPAKRKQVRFFLTYFPINHYLSLCACILQNIDVVCMPKPGDFVYDKHRVKCFVTGWGRRTESKF